MAAFALSYASMSFALNGVASCFHSLSGFERHSPAIFWMRRLHRELHLALAVLIIILGMRLENADTSNEERECICF